MLIWTIPTVIRIYQAVTGKAAPFGIATIDKVRRSVPHLLRDPFRLTPRTSLVLSSKGLRMHSYMVSRLDSPLFVFADAHLRF